MVPSLDCLAWDNSLQLVVGGARDKESMGSSLPGLGGCLNIDLKREKNNSSTNINNTIIFKSYHW